MTNSSDVSNILARLEQLEQIVNKCLSSDPATASIEAQAFRLKDESGRTRAKLACGKDGEPGLFLFNKEGKAVASFKLTPEGSTLVLKDAARNIVVRASSSTTEGSEITLSGRDGTDQLCLNVFSHNQVAIRLSDDEGNDRAFLAYSKKTGSMLALNSDHQIDGKPVMGVFAKGGEGDPKVTIADTAGQPRVELSFSESDNVAGVKLIDSQGRTRCGIAAGGSPESPEEPYMAFFGAIGEEPQIQVKIVETKGGAVAVGTPVLMLEGRDGTGCVVTPQGIRK